MGERSFNYPKHPLFGIAPMLDRGFHRVDHDAYTARLVGRIRAGKYTSDLWDCNSFYLGSPTRPAQETFSYKSRWKMTPQQMRDYQNTPEVKAERERASAERKARKAEIAAEISAFAARRRAEWEERQRVGREIEERLKAREAEQAERDREWAEREEALAREAEERRARSMALVQAELARRNAEYVEAVARQELRAAERALRRLQEERAKPKPNQQLLAIFARWLEPRDDRPNPENTG